MNPNDPRFSDPRLEKLNYLAAAIITAAAIHACLSLLSLPAVVASGEGALYAGTWRILRIIFLCLGTGVGAAVVFFASFIVNGRCFRKARIGIWSALALPFLGPVGAVTIFALLPLAIIAIVAFRHESWKGLFSDLPENVEPAFIGESMGEDAAPSEAVAITEMNAENESTADSER